MSEYPHLDSMTMSLLYYIYKNDYCNVRSLLQHFNIRKIEESPTVLTSLLYFIDKGLVGLLLTNETAISTYNFPIYLNNCVADQKSIINADYQLFILPEGRFIIEESQRQNRYFNIPLAVSIISAAISACALLYQIFDNSPILVKIIECLP